MTYSANLGRDADTIGAMCGAIAGAWRGVQGIRSDWAAKAQQATAVDQATLAANLSQVAMAKQQREAAAHLRFEKIAHCRTA